MTQYLLPKVRKRPRRQKPNDDAFREWIQTLPSCLSWRFSETVNGEGRNLACHVRRAGQSGTSYKALFSCVPMTRKEHDYQHLHGELACLQHFMSPEDFAYKVGGYWGRGERGAKAWFDEYVAYYREEWFMMHPEERL